MPSCEGLPDGPCPRNVNNRTVKLCQGDLMLCTACESARFPTMELSRKKRAVAVKPPKTDKAKADNAHVTANQSKQKCEAETNEEQEAGSTAVSLNNTVTDVHCPLCHDSVEHDENIKCNFCRLCYHQECSDLSVDTFNILITIVGETGWVCHNCKLHNNSRIDTLQTSLSHVGELLADMMVSMDALKKEVEELKRKDSSNQTASTGHTTGGVLADPTPAEAYSGTVQKKQIHQKM